MELIELLDRCLYEDELREILVTIGETPDGMKTDLLNKLTHSDYDTAEVLRLIDEDMLTIVCLESGVPTVPSKDEMVELILEDILGEKHDYFEISTKNMEAGLQPNATDSFDEELPDIDFDDVVNKIGGWIPVNTYLPKAVITNDLGDFLRREGFEVRVKTEFDIRLGGNVAVEMSRGRNSKDIDELLERIIQDLERVESVVGVMYGVESEEIVDQMEEALEGAFEDPDRVAIVLI
ncbi:MAG: hypothetical protein GKC03_08840 [Methanomassiliicoccales archaeon]|nr:hypothetical protein [Methanomassiliicoccales archaeon]NYT15388.1 hypothetical protein [Methanomassiliicoccales archaeon]